MVKDIERINNKEDYLEYVHTKVRKRSTELIKEIIDYCKNLEVDWDNLSIEGKGNIRATILEKARAAKNCMEIAGVLFEYDTMGDYRIRNKESLEERIESNMEGYELGTYKRS